MDRDYIWEGEYGRRSHLLPVFQQLLREQDASSLQMLSLFVNNNPYNLEFFIAVSYDRPKEEHLDRMFRLLEDAGLRQRKDLTARNIMRAMADRRFNSASLLDEDSVPTIMEHLFFFPEIRVLEEKGYRMTPFGREQMVFLSHSSLDKPEIEEIIPLLNGMDLPVWFDKYSIALGDSITDKVQEGIQQSSIVLFWITEHFLDSRWCKFEMRAFIKKLIEEDVRVISVLDRGIQISRLIIVFSLFQPFCGPGKTSGIAGQVQDMLFQHALSAAGAEIFHTGVETFPCLPGWVLAVTFSRDVFRKIIP